MKVKFKNTVLLPIATALVGEVGEVLAEGSMYYVNFAIYKAAFWILKSDVDIIDSSPIINNVPSIAPAGTTREGIGLGMVDNTSDIDKPISTATQSILNSRVSPSVVRNTIVIDGDSITGQNGYNPSGAYIYAEPGGFFTWANLFLGSRLTLLKNNGIGGENSTQLLARINNSIALNPAVIHVLIGTNDVSQTMAASVTMSNILSIYKAINAAGILCVLGTIPPRAAYYGPFVSHTTAVNQYIMNMQALYSGLIVVDYHGALVNPATDTSRTNMLYDSVHPSVQGAHTMGIALSEALDKFTPKLTVFQNTNGAIIESLVTNGCMLGGTTTATSWTGTVNSGIGTFAKVARPRGLEWQQVDFTILGDFIINQSIYTGWAVGEKWKLIVEYELDALAVPDRYGCSVYIRDVANTAIYVAESMFIASATAIRFPLEATSGVMETPVFTIPAGTVRLIPQLAGKLTGKIRFGRVRFIKVL